LLTGCAFGFSGGGLPPGIKTVAVLPFENQTSDPTLAQEVNRAVKDAVEGRLGLRSAGEKTADAIVQGTIKSYEPDLPAAFQGTGGAQGSRAGQVEVTRRLVRMSVDVEIINQRTGQSLWKQAGISVTGDYSPGRESEGRKKALEQLVKNIVDGAQSQW
jgi:hypothetical protein